MRGTSQIISIKEWVGKDIANKLMVTKGERGEGISWEFGINRYTPLYIK